MDQPPYPPPPGPPKFQPDSRTGCSYKLPVSPEHVSELDQWTQVGEQRSMFDTDSTSDLSVGQATIDMLPPPTHTQTHRRLGYLAPPRLGYLICMHFKC